MPVFKMRIVEADDTGYYYTNWSNAVPITIKAPTEKEALAKAFKIKGECRSGWHWVVIVDEIEAI